MSGHSRPKADSPCKALRNYLWSLQLPFSFMFSVGVKKLVSAICAP